MDLTELPRQIARTQRFTLGVPRSFTVSSDGRRVLFLRTRGGEDPVNCLWVREDGAERLLADPVALGERPGRRGTGRRAGPRERAGERSSGVVGYAADAAARRVVFPLGGRLWTVRTGGGAPVPVPTAAPVADPRPDPAGRRVAYAGGGALRVVEPDGTDRPLVAPEGPEVTYGLPEHVAAESMHRARGFWWSPDGQRLLVARVDNSPVGRWWIAAPANPHTPPREIRHPAAGTANAEVSLHVVALDGGRTEVVWDRTAFEYLVAAAWDTHGPMLIVQSRDQRTLRVLTADPDNGGTTLLHEERDPAWVEIIPGVPARTASGALVRTSDLDGSRRLVVDGRPVTPPGVHVRGVLGTDGERVLFTANEEPTEQHLWSYEPGRGPVRISDGPGVHTGTGAGGTLVLDSHTPRGREVRLLRDRETVGTIASLQAEPLITPRVGWLSAGEHEVRTALLLPSWYEPGARRLPVLMAPYSGPAMQLVTKARHWWLCEAQWFAECGFAVVIADGRGTPGRGPAWEKSVRGDKFGAVLEDQVTALHAAAAHCPDLDLGRVGIRGWSFGGALAAIAVMRRPDVFHAAVAGAPNTDPLLYDTHWSEHYLGHPDEEPENYARSSPVTEAASLGRPLLLVHGLADDNVVAAHTLRLSSALLAAGRPHQVLPLAGATHRPTDETVVARLLEHQLRFLRESLSLDEDGSPSRRG